MSILITLTDRQIALTGVPLELSKLLGVATSYLLAGHEHSPAYQAGYWDGYKKLISMSRDGKRLVAPSGLAQEVVDVLNARHVRYTLDDRRRFPAPRLTFKYDDPELRDYQLEAIEAATTPQGSLRIVGRGIIKMPPRSGKTRMAAGIIARFAVPTLFVVPASSLMYQAQRELSKALGVEVGVCGDGQWEPRDVTVATAQTLLSRRNDGNKEKPSEPEYVELLARTDCLILDEVHHMSGDSEWRRVVQDSGAPYKIGLSATVFLDRKSECELGVIWVRACTGDILINLSTSDLIERGFLVRPDVHLYPIRLPDLGKRGWSQKLKREAILLNDTRNNKIVDVTADLANRGMKIVVIANRHEQVNELCRLFKIAGVAFSRVVGDTKQKTRDREVDKLKRGIIRVLIGTVFGEGVDIPEVDAVVNAEGGAGVKPTYQRLRCLTPHDGKTTAVVVDFIDLMHPYFARHSIERLAVYRSERAFRVSVVR